MCGVVISATGLIENRDPILSRFPYSEEEAALDRAADAKRLEYEDAVFEVQRCARRIRRSQPALLVLMETVSSRMYLTTCCAPKPRSRPQRSAPRESVRRSISCVSRSRGSMGSAARRSAGQCGRTRSRSRPAHSIASRTRSDVEHGRSRRPRRAPGSTSRSCRSTRSTSLSASLRSTRRPFASAGLARKTGQRHPSARESRLPASE